VSPPRSFARPLLVGACVALAACQNRSQAAGDAAANGAPDSSAAPSISIDAATPAADAEARAGQDAGFDRTDPWDACSDTTSSPRSGKSIGHTSVVFKLELSTGRKVAWKPNAKKVKGRYKGEVAAYRLGRALAIANVIPACLRVFDQATTIAALTSNPDAAAALADQAIVEDGKIYGVTISWVDGLQFWPLEKDPLRTDAKTWLTAGDRKSVV
jgi:hypothetical protein